MCDNIFLESAFYIPRYEYKAIYAVEFPSFVCRKEVPRLEYAMPDEASSGLYT